MSQYIIKQMDEAEQLLANFGLKVSGFYPGVAARDEKKKEIEFSKNGWEFVKPLLQELIVLRNGRSSERTLP